MKKLTLPILSFALVFSADAQDQRWLGMWERAQEERPDRLESVARIASSTEPGTPMVIHGRVWNEEGDVPLSGVIIFAYQTDDSGLYHERGASDWRLRGWAVSDRDGRFEFRTIRPGSYPSRNTPAHVHFTVEGDHVPRQWTNDLKFADDPLVRRSARERSGSADRFDEVRPVEIRDGVQHVEVHLRASGRGRF